METNQKQWWYELNGDQRGPVTKEEIQALIKSGALTSKNLVWKQGWPNWIGMNETEFISDFNIRTPPPINSTASILPTKWYNKKVRLWLSLLIWPVFFYGYYKTDLYQKRTKVIVTCILIGLFVWGSFLPNDPGTAVHQSPFDKSVPCVESYLKYHYLRDPDSYQSIRWSKVIKNDDGTYSVSHIFRAHNGFGGMTEETKTFTIASDGETVIRVGDE